MYDVTIDEPQTKRRGPERTCVGCRAHDAQVDLVRFAFDGARLVHDPASRLGGRGVWVHGSRACVERAVRAGGFARVLRSKVPFDAAVVRGLILADAEARLSSLLLGARRARLLVVGVDPCRDALARGAGKLAILAKDACASEIQLGEVARNAAVPVLENGTKSSLGRVFGKEESGPVVVVDAGLASSISRVATRIAALSEGE